MLKLRIRAHPRKLKVDAIAEALIEVRFDCPDAVAMPEAVVTALARYPQARGFAVQRLPIADLPTFVRTQDPNLKHQPWLEFTSANRIVKIGQNSLSYHVLPPYPGWESFRLQLEEIMSHLYLEIQDLSILRIGFRYINLLTEEDHQISSAADLHCAINIEGKELDAPYLLQYNRQRGEDHLVQAKIADPIFVVSNVNKAFNVLVDVDVFTARNVGHPSKEWINEWVENAHTFEKDEFFRILGTDNTKRLRED
jgi:uncharacterized protein (TIGR04255 family)